MDKQFQPPPHLSDRAKSLWREYIPRKAKSPGRLALVQAALEALDRAETARTAVAREGMTSVTKSTGAIHVHPLLKIEREARQQFTRLWVELGLGFDHPSGDRR